MSFREVCREKERQTTCHIVVLASHESAELLAGGLGRFYVKILHKSLWAFYSSASENFEEEKQVRVYTVCQWLNLTEKLSPYWEIRLIWVTDALQAVCWGDLSCKRNKSRAYIGLQIDFPGSRSFLLFMWCIRVDAGRQCSSQELPWTSFVEFPRLGCLFPPKESGRPKQIYRWSS